MSKITATGGQILVKSLSFHGVDKISCVAGESYLAALDAMLDHKNISVITCRQEGGAAFMAESWGKLTGRPGICFVTRGPGVCNASIGIHTAMQDSTPMILFMGQVGRAERGREAFQEVDVRAVFGTLAKWATEIDDPAAIPEVINRAFKVAMSGRPGPVVIGLPEDMLTQQATVTMPPPATPVMPGIDKNALNALKDILKGASRPVVIIGGGTWNEQGIADFAKFANACHLPVAASFRRHDLFDHGNACYAGELGTGPNPALTAKVKEADLIISFGARLNEITTQTYTLLEPPVAKQKLIHIHSSENELGKVYTPALAIHADVNALAAELAGGFGIDGRKWAGWKEELRSQYLEWTKIDVASRPQWNGADMTVIFEYLRRTLPKDSIVTTDAGNFSGWAQRYLQYGRPGRLLAPLSGAMGYAVPSAVGASLAAPDKIVLGLCGDGGFMMTGQEIATAIHHSAKPIIMVCNNGMYGTIRMHQERDYPTRVHGTELKNPDFAAYARAFGGHGETVERTADFEAAFERALGAGKPSIIHVKTDAEAITSRITMTKLREQALAKQKS